MDNSIGVCEFIPLSEILKDLKIVQDRLDEAETSAWYGHCLSHALVSPSVVHIVLGSILELEDLELPQYESVREAMSRMVLISQRHPALLIDVGN